jgi:dTDP-4-dehydrorhamnose reductase
MIWFCLSHPCGLGRSRTADAGAPETITTAQYPTAARRPVNSRLNSSKAAQVFGIRLHAWRQALELCRNEMAISEIGTQTC